MTLDVRDLHAVYGKSRVLHGVTLHAAQGEVVCLLGRNGAGKSSTLRAIVGLVEITSGEVRLDDRSLRGLPTHAIARLGVGLVPEDRRIFADLSVVDNLVVGARAGGGWSLERVFGLFPTLRRLASRLGGSLSGGEQQMLTIARTLMTGPRVLLLDEPSEGLAPVVVQALADNISALKREGLAIVMAEQNLKLARRLADRAYIIEKGQIRFDGSMAALDADESLRRAYLAV